MTQQETTLERATRSVQGEWRQTRETPLRRFVLTNRASLGSLAVFLIMLMVFVVANPSVFTSWTLYSSVLTTLPVAMFTATWARPRPMTITTGPMTTGGSR